MVAGRRRGARPLLRTRRGRCGRGPAGGTTGPAGAARPARARRANPPPRKVVHGGRRARRSRRRSRRRDRGRPRRSRRDGRLTSPNHEGRRYENMNPLHGVVPYPAAAADRYTATGAWGTRSLPTAFRQAATTYAERTALITPDTRLTYRELDARSDAVAAGLLSSGLRLGERVLLQLTNSAAAVVAWYGLLKAGLIPVCTLAIHRRLEIEQIGRKSGAVAHLVQADFPGFDLVGLAQQVTGLLPAMRHLVTVGAAPDQPGLRIEDLQDHEVNNTERAGLLAIAESLDAHGAAVLQLSGGTTGTPKIIPRLHAEYRYNADLTSRWWRHTEHSVLAFGLPLAHNAALTNGLHAAHGAGAALLLATPAADVMLPLMAEHGATWTMSPPGLAREYLSHPAFGDAVAGLGTWVLTAARVPRPVFDELTS